MDRLDFVTRAQRFAPSRPEPIHTSMLRVLILEDRPDDALLVAEHLRRAGLAFAWERVETEAAFAAKAATPTAPMARALGKVPWVACQRTVAITHRPNKTIVVPLASAAMAR